MSGYKFNINPRPPKEDKIAAHRDFGKVMHGYKRITNPLYRTPLYRYRKIFMILLLIFVVAWVVSEYGDEHSTEMNQHQIDSARKADSIAKGIERDREK